MRGPSCSPGSWGRLDDFGAVPMGQQRASRSSLAQRGTARQTTLELECDILNEAIGILFIQTPFTSHMKSINLKP